MYPPPSLPQCYILCNHSTLLKPRNWLVQLTQAHTLCRFYHFLKKNFLSVFKKNTGICKSHTRKFSLFKGTVLWLLLYSQDCATIPLSNSRTFHHPKRNLVPGAVTLPSPPPAPGTYKSAPCLCGPACLTERAHTPCGLARPLSLTEL